MVKTVTNLPLFERRIRQLDEALKSKLKKLIDKIVENPAVGKPLRYVRKGTRELYMHPFRLSYSYDPQSDAVTFLDLYHKKRQ